MASIARFAFLGASCGMTLIARAQIHPTIIPGFRPSAVSADGRVVAGATTSGEAAYWTAAEGIVSLGIPQGAQGALAEGVSADGSVIAGSGLDSTGYAASSWVWTPAAGMIPLTVPGTIHPRATCVSRDGTTVGGAAIDTSVSQYRAFVWTMRDGGRLVPQGTNYSTWIHALSPSGLRAVGSGYSGQGTWAMLWRSTYVWCENLGMVPGSTTAIAYAMTGSGDTVVGLVGTSAFVWTENGGLAVIPNVTLPGNVLRAVSDDGSIAAGGDYGFSFFGVVWRRGAGMFNAVDYFQARSVQIDFIADITAMSANGRVFVGPANTSNPPSSTFVIDLGPCGSADFDHDGNPGTDADIEAFFRCLAGDCCPLCDSADFNYDGDAATDADIEAFFRVLAGGSC